MIGGGMAAAAGHLVEVRHLSRQFVVRHSAGGLRRAKRVVTAVDDISFTLDAGEAVGYIGANGAGKSTTIKMLTGILVPTSGEVTTCGYSPVRQRRELARHVGVVFGQRSQLWWDLPLAESFRVLGAVHGMPDDVWRARRDELVEQLDMRSFLTQPVRQLSLGQRMRGEVAAALLHSPRLVVLDEPTIGLDVLSKERLRQFLRAQREARGTTLLLTTHDMGDIERLCDRVLVVDHGRLAYDGTLPGLVHRVGAERVLVVDLTEPHAPLDDVPGTSLVGVEGEGLRQRLAFSPDCTTAAAVRAAVSERAEVNDLAVEEPVVEEVVRRLYLSAGSSA
jgi:ABC-2 type transport system ATP-binding protein